MHSVIEKQVTRYKKSAPIYVPEQYITLIRQAKKTGKPYTVLELTHDNFYDFKDLSERLGVKTGYRDQKGVPLKISDIKVLKVEKAHPEYFSYKLSYEEEQFSTFMVLNIRRKSSNVVSLVLKKAYNKKVGISEAKKKGIMTLIQKNSIPSFYTQFYNNL